MNPYEIGVELALSDVGLEKTAASPWLLAQVGKFEKGPALRKHLMERFKEYYAPKMLAGAGIGGTLGALSDDSSLLQGAGLGALGGAAYGRLRSALKGLDVTPYERSLVRT